MYKCINGWTKARMIEAIMIGNNGERSMGASKCGTPQCQYRGADGNKCAVGCFISDKDYDPALEAQLPHAFSEALMAKMPLDSWALRLMQHAHDDYNGFANVREAIISWINNNVSDSSDDK